MSVTCAETLSAALTTVFDQRGLVSLSYNGQTLVDANARSGDAFSIWGYDLGGTGGFGGNCSSWDPANKILTCSGNWGGTVKVQYATPAGTDHLNLTITITNPSGQPLNGLNILTMGLQFPQFPPSFVDPGYPNFHNNLDQPVLIPADYGSGMMVLADGDAKPLWLGFSPTGVLHYNVWAGTLNDSTFGAFGTQVNPVIRPIPPGGTDVFQFSLRFAPSGTDYQTVANDVLLTYGQTWPQTLHWTDRRPIGELFMTNPTNSPIPDNNPNPRNYSVASGINIQTPAGLAAFHQAVLAYADNAVQIIKNTGGQGGIVWDLEGQQYKQDGGEGNLAPPTCGGVPGELSYVGSPDMLPQISPEMDSIADAFFKKFTDAGLRCGMTLRPQKPVLAGAGSYQNWCPTRDQAQTAALLIQKAQYAFNRWGCTLFYVDSDGGPSDSTAPSAWAAVNQAMPNVLMIPENIYVKDSAYTAPLATYFAPYKPLHTTPDERLMWPNAATVTYIGDAPGGSLTPLHDEYVQAVRNGDILSFRAWFDDQPLNSQVKQIYADAGVGPPPFSPCDINLDASTNVIDVQMEVNQAVGITACTADINRDSFCNIIDVQRVVNAALGGLCVSP